MISQPNRLAQADHAFSGTLIDRGKPLSFLLNGHRIAGFAGDTVLSAALASGLDVAGTLGGAPIAMTEDFAPAVVPTAKLTDRTAALPMARLPALDGQDLTSVGTRASRRTPTGLLGAVDRMLFGTGRSLGHIFDRASELAGPWVDMPVTETIAADLAIVGGGVAGMSAAIASARLGERIVLIERGPVLGGEARYFGGADGEETPSAAVERLREEIAGLTNVTVLTLTEAFALYDREIRAHRVALSDGAAIGTVIAVDARRLVLATGAFERLPVFTGNRSPGVTGAVAAFRRADRFGIFGRGATLISTSGNAAYRLATMAHDAGITVQQVFDSRLLPQSRFIDYSKAYGIKFARGLRVQAVAPGGRRNPGLSVSLAYTGAETVNQIPPVWAGQLIVAGGWQPSLALWYMAGGTSRWNANAARLEAQGKVDGVALAGAVAGYITTAGCKQSGFAATAALFGRRQPSVDDRTLPPEYETPEDRTPIADYGSHGLAYLDSGTSLTVRPAPPRPARFKWLRGETAQRFAFADQTHTLTVGDIAAGVQIGAVPEADAGTVAQERCVIAGDLVDMARQHAIDLPRTRVPPLHIPHYLRGRLAGKTSLWRIAADDGRDFDPGCTIHASSDKVGPFDTIGIVIGPVGNGVSGAHILLTKPDAAAEDRLYARDLSGPVSVKLIEKVKT